MSIPQRLHGIFSPVLTPFDADYGPDTQRFANVNPGSILRLFKTWREADAEGQQKKLDATRAVFAKFPMIPAMKAAIVWKSGRADWKHVRPPLVHLDDEQQKALRRELDAVGFHMPNADALA